MRKNEYIGSGQTRGRDRRTLKNRVAQTRKSMMGKPPSQKTWEKIKKEVKGEKPC